MPPPLQEDQPFPIFLGPHRVRDELSYRLRQQSLLAEFSRTVLQTRDVQEILQRATELCAWGLEAAFAQAIEFLPGQQQLVVRASSGWAGNPADGVIFAADNGSPAGRAYSTGETIISNDLAADPRFELPRFLSDHGATRAINVLIERGGDDENLFGVLEVVSTGGGAFDQADADCLKGFAGLLGIAIERQQADARLQEALDYQALLTREMSHRVKNSLTSVVGLLRVQSRSAASDEIRSAIDDAGSRVATIAAVHDHLWRGSRIGFIDLADFLNEFCKKLQGAAGIHVIDCRADAMQLSADHAVPLGLLVNELVSNAIKHAYPDGSGVIEVSARKIRGRLQVDVSDRGVGLPEGFDIDQTRTSLGFKVITGLVRQLHGKLSFTSNDPKGARFLFELPILPERAKSSHTADLGHPSSLHGSVLPGRLRPGNSPAGGD